MRYAALVLPLLFLSACDGPFLSGGGGRGRTHRIRPGESLYSIAEAEYGNGLEWPRIWDANRWIDPDRLVVGDPLYLPTADEWGGTAPYKAHAADSRTTPYEEPTTAQQLNPTPARGLPGLQEFRNIASTVSSKTLFGFPVHHLVLYGFGFCVLHALVQSLLVWLAANLTFVKDASMKKASRAVFQTNMLTFCTLLILTGLGVLFVHVPGESSTSSVLLPDLESFLRTDSGMAAGAIGILILYVILSMRFLPAAFGIARGRGASLMCLAVLIPHLAAMYLVGQRMGFIL